MSGFGPTGGGPTGSNTGTPSTPPASYNAESRYLTPGFGPGPFAERFWPQNLANIPTKLLVSQIAVETWGAPAATTLNTSQIAIESWAAPAPTALYTSQIAVETWGIPPRSTAPSGLLVSNAQVLNRVKQYTSTTGSGLMTLGSVVTGFQTW